LPENLLEVLKGLLILREQEQSQAESSPGHGILVVDSQELPAFHENLADVVHDVGFESEDDLTRGEPRVKAARGKVVGLALRVAAVISSTASGDVAGAVSRFDLGRPFEVAESVFGFPATLVGA
jgi:hypothetical protein